MGSESLWNDPADQAAEFVMAALPGDAWEVREGSRPDECWIERGAGAETERFLSAPLGYLDACKVERLIAEARHEFE